MSVTDIDADIETFRDIPNKGITRLRKRFLRFQHGDTFLAGKDDKPRRRCQSAQERYRSDKNVINAETTLYPNRMTQGREPQMNKMFAGGSYTILHKEKQAVEKLRVGCPLWAMGFEHVYYLG